MLTFWVNGEDVQRRMSRLAPPTLKKTPVPLPPTGLPRPLQKMPSAPSIRYTPSGDEAAEDNFHETDKLLNGLVGSTRLGSTGNQYKPSRLPGRDRVNSDDANIAQLNRTLWFRSSASARGSPGQLKIHISDDNTNRVVAIDDAHSGINGWSKARGAVSWDSVDPERGLLRFGSIREQGGGGSEEVGGVGPPPPYTSLGRRGRSGSGGTHV